MSDAIEQRPPPDQIITSASGAVAVHVFDLGRETWLIPVRTRDGRVVLAGDAEHDASCALLDGVRLRLRSDGRRVYGRHVRAYADAAPHVTKREASESMAATSAALDTLAEGLRRSAVVGAYWPGPLTLHATTFGRVSALRDELLTVVESQRVRAGVRR